MANLKQLNWIRSIPDIGGRLHDFALSVQQSLTTIEQQANVSTTSAPAPPPNIQGLTVTAKNGHFQYQISDTAPGLRRGASYFVEHADNPSFTNSHTVELGQTRNGNDYLGNVTRYFRAYSAYSASDPSAHVYHGSAIDPVPVSGGGDNGGPDFQSSQGTGTGAPGQGGVGPGPVQERSDISGFDWTKQRAGGLRGGFQGTGTPAGEGATDTGSGGGGGGGLVTTGLLVDTHARRLSIYPSVNYPLNTEFYETDRTTLYWTQNASGTVTVTGGTTVTWVSGNKFINSGSGFTAAQWRAGTRILINGVICHVASVSSSTVLTLQAATTNAAGVSYSVASGRWVYLAGECSTVQANIPSDLGEADAGFLSNVTDYAHIIQWSGSSFSWGPGESGSGYFADFAVAPTGSGWHLCDGSAGVAYLKKDGTTATLTLPNTNGTTSYRKLASTYSATITAAQAPTLTPAGIVSQPTFAGTPDAGIAIAAGAGSQAVGAPYTPLGTVTQPTFTGTSNQNTTLPGDPIAHFQAISYFRQ